MVDTLALREASVLACLIASLEVVIVLVATIVYRVRTAEILDPRWLAAGFCLVLVFLATLMRDTWIWPTLYHFRYHDWFVGIENWYWLNIIGTFGYVVACMCVIRHFSPDGIGRTLVTSCFLITVAIVLAVHLL